MGSDIVSNAMCCGSRICSGKIGGLKKLYVLLDIDQTSVVASRNLRPSESHRPQQRLLCQEVLPMQKQSGCNLVVTLQKSAGLNGQKIGAGGE